MQFNQQARPAVITAFIIAAFIMLVAFLLLKLSAMHAGWIFYLLIFIFTFLMVGISFRVLYRRVVMNQLRSIYEMVFRIRYPGNVPPIFDRRQDYALETTKLLNDWDTVAKEEIGQLKQAEQYRREFLGNVSHELKTPIFSVQGFIHTLLDGGIEDPDINLLYLKKASKGIDRLISMVQDLESISRLEAGILELDERTFDLTELAREVIESLETISAEKKISLLIREDKPHYVIADKDMIRQVLVNLFVNSLKYGKEGGSTSFSATEDENTVIASVSDTGIGIEKHHLKRLFERFYRVDKSRSRDQGGTGLGLAIVKHILEAHHQQIAVDSEPGKGTTFTFSLRKSR